MSIATTPDYPAYRQVAQVLQDAGMNGFAGAADALYRVYDSRREAGFVSRLRMIPRYLSELPDGQGLPQLSEIAQKNNDEFGEAGLHAGQMAGPYDRLLDVSGASAQAMLHMSELPREPALSRAERTRMIEREGP